MRFLCRRLHSKFSTIRMAFSSAKQFASAAERNKEPILSVLRKYLSNEKPLCALEIASGTGQHVEYFAKAFKNVTWLPSEVDQVSLASISAYTDNVPNILKPIYLDVSFPFSSGDSKIAKEKFYDLIMCINMIHITPQECTLGLFAASDILLKDDGLLILYGPFAFGGKIFPESNVQFDKSLKRMDSRFGLRDVNYLINLAKENNLILIGKEDMPANNNILIFKKVVV